VANSEPWVMLLKGAFQDGWLLCGQAEKDRVFDYWISCLSHWPERGVHFICSLDSEMLHVGEAVDGSWNFYVVFEVPGPEVCRELLDFFRYPKDDGPRLDKYFRFEVVLGNPISSVDAAFK
jgi:hypothetical protein